MSVSFCHASAPLVPREFCGFTDMVLDGEVNTSSANVAAIEFELGWRFERSHEGGPFIGEIPLADLPQFIENCDIALNTATDRRELVTQRIAQLRALAKQAMRYGESITYG